MSLEKHIPPTRNSLAVTMAASGDLAGTLYQHQVATSRYNCEYKSLARVPVGAMQRLNVLTGAIQPLWIPMSIADARFTNGSTGLIPSLKRRRANALRKLKRKDEAKRVEQELRSATKLSSEDPGSKHRIDVSDLRPR